MENNEDNCPIEIAWGFVPLLTIVTPEIVMKSRVVDVLFASNSIAPPVPVLSEKLSVSVVVIVPPPTGKLLALA